MARQTGGMGLNAGLLGAGLLFIAGCRERQAGPMTVSALTGPAGTVESADPTLALDPASGDLLLSWVGGDSAGWSLYFARSTDRGTNWSEPAVVAAGHHEVHPHGESSPRLVAGEGGRVAVTWTNDIELPGRKWPGTRMRLSSSLDGGRTWARPVTLNDDTNQAPVSHQFHGAARSGDSGLVVTWLDERKGSALEIHHGDHAATAADVTDEPDASIYMAYSPDFGRTWQPNAMLWGQVCPCCRVSLARASNGEVVSAWRKHFPGNIRDVVTASVSEGAEPERVHQDDWVYPGCPHTGPAISVGGDAVRHIAWYVGKEGDAGVYYQRLLSGADDKVTLLALLRARTLPTAHTSVTALQGGGALAAYDITETGDRAIGVSLIGADRRIVQAHDSVPGSLGGQYPQVLAVGRGSAVLAWTGTDGDKRRVRLARIMFPEVEPESK